MEAADIAGSVKVRGRGGTVLQPGVELLEHAQDFPKGAPCWSSPTANVIG